MTDKGIARVVDKSMTGRVGTPAYIAPEVLEPPYDYTEKADVYRFSYFI
jgi:serine/threonine protein kinase